MEIEQDILPDAPPSPRPHHRAMASLSRPSPSIPPLGTSLFDNSQTRPRKDSIESANTFKVPLLPPSKSDDIPLENAIARPGTPAPMETQSAQYVSLSHRSVLPSDAVQNPPRRRDRFAIEADDPCNDTATKNFERNVTKMCRLAQAAFTRADWMR